ncbi:MAG: lipopolysaccharide assembly protein LapB [Chromatiales bacterium]|nr:lipopolysaccharide assembly protein LapB [Chromatiales bacterium]
MIEYALFLIPVAAAVGWWSGHRSAARRVDLGVSLDCGRDYLKGLNYLLNEQPDKAIDIFIRMIEVDSETVETHLALGHLFRRRGEVDRAIRIHQNLIARPTLSKDQRAGALLELGLDYMRAGLFDRAESLFAEVVETGVHCESALEQLLMIYQQEKDWTRAIDVGKRLQTYASHDWSADIAQFHCQLAEEALARSDRSEAQTLLNKALAADKNCVRAVIMQGDLARRANDWKGALKQYRRVEEIDSGYLPEVLIPMRDSFIALGAMNDWRRHLEIMLERRASIGGIEALADLIAAERGVVAAGEFLLEKLQRQPSLEGLYKLMSMSLDGRLPPSIDALRLFRELAAKLLDSQPHYRCENCGYPAGSLHWQCPSCKQWSTIKPLQGPDWQLKARPGARHLTLISSNG